MAMPMICHPMYICAHACMLFLYLIKLNISDIKLKMMLLQPELTQVDIYIYIFNTKGFKSLQLVNAFINELNILTV